MPRLRSLLLSTLCLTPFAMLCGTAPASASHSQTTYFEGGQLLLETATRPKAIAQLQSLGVDALRIELYWANVAPAPNSASKPNFEASNPSAYNWGQYDALMAEAARLHWKVLLTVTGPAPRWATSNHTAPYITRPDDKDFEEFMTAVARHYGPEVTLYSIWNEPNHPAFLLPQWRSNGEPESPRIYRGLYQAGYAGLQTAGLTHPKVLFGETAPTGYEKVRRKEGASAKKDVAPLLFLREALCLNSHYKKAGGCTELQMSGYAHHAYFKSPAGPHFTPKETDDVTIASISRLTSALNKAAAVHAIPSGVPVYLTEFGVESQPNKYENLPVAQQAEYDAIAEQMAYNNSRVASFSQYLLRDDKLGDKPGSSANGTGTVGFQTGLEYVSGQPKPLYTSFPVPLTVTKRSHGVALWGLVRPATGTTKVTVLIRKKGSSAYKTLKTVATNSAGYWTLDSSVIGQYWRVRWTSPAGKRYEGPPTKAY
jgi:hypothetical protein